MLRVRADDPDKRDTLVRAFQRIRRLHPGRTFSLAITANVILKADDKESYRIYYGQSYGSAKAIFAGQRSDVEGKADRLFREHLLTTDADAAAVPTEFDREEFAAIFKRNFETSAVTVHSILNVVFIFGLGLEDYEKDRTVGQKLIKLW